ncbi:39S ribosomal protein L46, mitochondrial [Diorhabda sublineata]|uniref:39S ribosomal protein L46, mitochondrial n=1 Tax=Diorhabda sublineata TaxID=1163346 RepID=UPI0024E1127F|nr:39S ribosomal protein L46, mitochondrial [Diorhabda sublineata]
MLSKRFLLLKGYNQLKHSLRTQTQNIHGEKWDLFAAVCLERKPVVTAELNDLEKEYKQLMSDMHFENSLKSNFELRHEAEVKNLTILKQGGEIDDKEITLKQTAQDLEDLWSTEAKEFKAEDRVTDADRNNDLKSLDRKLDKHLVFVLNQKVGDKKLYLLPQGIRKDGETLRQSAERILKDSVGTELKAQIYGNAPCGFYKYRYPSQVKNEKNSVGAKVFIYFARYLKGQPPQKNLDYKWLDRNELQKAFLPKYNSSIKQFLIDE